MFLRLTVGLKVFLFFYSVCFLFVSPVYAADDPAPIDLQVYIPIVSTEKRECAIGDIGKACKTDEECNKSIEGKTIKGRCVTKATAVVDPDDKTGGIISYIGGVYKFLVGIAALAAVFMIMIAGYRWLFAGGNTGAIDDAKTKIKGAVAGLVIALLSYTILNLINPDLTKLSLENVPEGIQKVGQDIEGARDNIEQSLNDQCPPDVEVVDPQQRRAPGSLTVCGSQYAFLNPTPELLKAYPDGTCLGRVCYKGVKVGAYKTGVEEQDNGKECKPIGDKKGFLCEKSASTKTDQKNANSICDEAKNPATCYQVKLMTKAVKATNNLRTCFWDASLGACVSADLVKCRNNEVRIHCEGSSVIGFTNSVDVNLALDGFGTTENECNKGWVQICSNDTFQTFKSQGICCAPLKGVTLEDIKKGISCKDQCKPNEVQVKCSDWNIRQIGGQNRLQGTPYKNTGNNAACGKVCCLPVRWQEPSEKEKKSATEVFESSPGF